MARTRRRSSYRKSKRWNPTARRSGARRSKSRRRNCMNPAKSGYKGISRSKFRRKTIWKMARRGKKSYRSLNPRGRKSRRRNPSQFDRSVKPYDKAFLADFRSKRRSASAVQDARIALGKGLLSAPLARLARRWIKKTGHLSTWSSHKTTGRRRNPSGTELRDGTMISISGSNVTISSPYGETYEYDEVSSSALKKLRTASSFGSASRIASSGGVTRSINPKRRGRKSRSRRSYARR